MAVQIPTTEFYYDGKLYSLVVSIGTVEDPVLPVEVDKNKKFQMLANQNMHMLEFSNELNTLCMTGSLVYKDVEGYVTAFLPQTNIAVIVDLKQILVTEDGIAAVKTVDEANTLYHVFLVNNIEIIDRDGGVVTYKLHLVSSNFNGLVKVVQYSNYAREPEAVTDILKAVLAKAATGFGEKPLFGLDASFTGDKNSKDKKVESAVKLHYVTNCNDNAMTVAKFLLSRMFYYQTNNSDCQMCRDSSMKLIYYNQHDNTYGLLDLAKVDKTKAANDKIVLSMFKTPEEELMYSEQNQLASVVSFPQTKYKKLVFGTLTYDYSLMYNTICQEYISQKTMTSYHDSSDAKQLADVQPQTEPKDAKKDPDYMNQQPYWNNDFNVYQTMVESLLGQNALVVDTGPNVRRMPADCLFIAIPPDKSNVTTDSEKAYESVAGRYGQMQGEWIVGKVRNIFYPAESRYRQNLVLFKNFLTSNEIAK